MNKYTLIAAILFLLHWAYVATGELGGEDAEWTYFALSAILLITFSMTYKLATRWWSVGGRSRVFSFIGFCAISLLTSIYFGPATMLLLARNKPAPESCTNDCGEGLALATAAAIAVCVVMHVIIVPLYYIWFRLKTKPMPPTTLQP